jgi:hypothetical protein
MGDFNLKSNNMPSQNKSQVETNQKLVLDALMHLGKKAIEVFDLIVSYSNNYMDVYPSRKTIALQVRCDISYVDKVIAKLVEIGAIIKINRGKGKHITNLYRINPIFYIAEIRDQLRYLIRNFCKWGMASLMRAKEVLSKKESLLICTYNYINAFSKKIREWSSKDDIEFLQQREKERSEPKNVLKRINDSIFKRLAEKYAKEWCVRSQKAMEERKYIAAASFRYKPTQEELNKLLKKVEHSV